MPTYTKKRPKRKRVLAMVLLALTLIAPWLTAAAEEGNITVTEVFMSVEDQWMVMYLTPESAVPNAKQVQAAVCYFLEEFDAVPPVRYEFYRWTSIEGTGGYEPVKLTDGVVATCDESLKDA